MQTGPMFEMRFWRQPSVNPAQPGAKLDVAVSHYHFFLLGVTVTGGAGGGWGSGLVSLTFRNTFRTIFLLGLAPKS
jgi:hypothetical protein